MRVGGLCKRDGERLAEHCRRRRRVGVGAVGEFDFPGEYVTAKRFFAEFSRQFNIIVGRWQFFRFFGFVNFGERCAVVFGFGFGAKFFGFFSFFKKFKFKIFSFSKHAKIHIFRTFFFSNIFIVCNIFNSHRSAG